MPLSRNQRAMAFFELAAFKLQACSDDAEISHENILGLDASIHDRWSLDINFSFTPSLNLGLCLECLVNFQIVIHCYCNVHAPNQPFPIN